MRYTRGGIIAVLLAAEAFVAGAILWSLGAGRFRVADASVRRIDQTARTFAPIAAASGTQVVVDDPRSYVTVGAASDGAVHVTDDSEMHGWGWHGTALAPLQVERIPGGVRISRAGSGPQFAALFGFDRERIVITMPPAAALNIAACAGASVSGLTAAVQVHSADGDIVLSDVHAARISLRTDDGGLQLNDVQTGTIDAITQDGSIRAHSLDLGGGTLQTDDGSINVELASSDLRVHAGTQDGSVHFNGRRIDSDDDASAADFQIGAGGGRLALLTHDGNIHITTMNGAQ